MFKMSVYFAVISLLLTILPFQAHGSHGGGGGGRKKLAVGCDLFKGRWVLDLSYPMYNGSGCPFINPGLNCHNNGRTDELYLKYRWQPLACQLPRFNGQDFLWRNRGKKIMFVGDSLSSNQWQSLACMLYYAVPHAKHVLVHQGPLSHLFFPEYGVSVMYLKNGFLVDLVVDRRGRILKLDSISRSGKWQGVDILIFNSYHWWTHTGHLRTWDYYQVGDKLYKNMDQNEAYRIALTTWSKWVDSNVDLNKSRVFFQGISAVHNEGKDWNEPYVKNCGGQTVPIQGSKYPGRRYPGEEVVKDVLAKMQKPVYLLDITLLTQLRKDGHPSKYASGRGTDCSHWCLAGVPDTWNQILYNLLIEY